MPYIQQEDRASFDGGIADIIDIIFDNTTPDNHTGMLNYVITSLLHEYLIGLQCAGHTLHYSDYSRVRGVLNDASDEFYRTVMGPYEDKKREENGNVSVLEK